MVNRYTIHLDVLAPDPETTWAKADALADDTDAYAYALTTADDWACHVKHPQDQS